MAYEAAVQAKVIQLFLAHAGNIAGVVKQLKQEDYKISRATIQGWLDEAYPNEKKKKTAIQEYVSQLALYQASMENFLDDSIASLLVLREKYRKQLKDNKDIHSQDVLALINLTKELQRLTSVKTGEEIKSDQNVEEVVAFFLNHPVVGKALEPYHDIIISEIEKILGKKK